MTKIKKNLRLPEWLALEIRAANAGKFIAITSDLVDLGWTLESIARERGCSRERVRQLNKLAKERGIESGDSGLPLPEPPTRAEKPKVTYVEPSRATLERLLELQPLAQRVRSNSRSFRREAEEYTALLNHSHKVEKVTLYRLAKRLGVTHGAVRFRLVRYGYIEPKTGKSKVYRPINPANRY